MLSIPMTTTNQYGSETNAVFEHETISQSPSNGFVGLPPPPPPPPAPPVLNHCQILLPHQEVRLVVNRIHLTEIQARSIPSMLTSSSNIWTRRVLPDLLIKQTVFEQHFGDTKSSMISSRHRRASVSTSPTGGGGILNDDGPLSFVLLDATSKMLYDVPMRHLLQLVKKDYDDDASIDHVIRAIDQTRMKSEWLDAVTALNKQFDKRPEDKARVLAHKGSTHGLVLIEQFFVKLVRVPAYEFKLIFLKFCEEAPTQLERMGKHITDLLESIEVILTNEQLPGILHLLCLLYNSITGKAIPGLHFDSLLSVLSTRTSKQTATITHLLCQLLEEQYPKLLHIFDDQIFLKLKDLSAIKYPPIYVDVRSLYSRYEQLNLSLKTFHEQLIVLPEHIQTTLNDLQVQFTKLFNDENQVKKGEKDLAIYFCSCNLSLEICLSTLGQLIDKLRLAHMQNLEQRRRDQLLTKQQQQRTIQTPTRSFQKTHNVFCSDTNIFRDHLNVPLTPISARQRYKINRAARDRYASSRDVSYDEQQEQFAVNLLPNAIPRKRGHSPAAKTVLTKRPFNVLGLCPTNKRDDAEEEEETDDVFIAATATPNNDCKETAMDCSTNESAIVPTIFALPTYEHPLSFYLTTPIEQLFHSSTDQSIPIKSPILPIEYQAETSTTDKENTSTELLSSLNLIEDTDYTNNDIDIPSTSQSQPMEEDYENRSNLSRTVPTTKPTLCLSTFTKRAASAENLRFIAAHNFASRNIQRCGVSRRICTEKHSKETSRSSPVLLAPVSITNRLMPSTRPKHFVRTVQPEPKTSSFSRPLRAFATVLPTSNTKNA